MSADIKANTGIKPEVLAAISAAIALYGLSTQSAIQGIKIKKGMSPWRKAGITEIMLGRDLNRDYI